MLHTVEMVRPELRPQCGEIMKCFVALWPQCWSHRGAQRALRNGVPARPRAVRTWAGVRRTRARVAPGCARAAHGARPVCSAQRSLRHGLRARVRAHRVRALR